MEESENISANADSGKLNIDNRFKGVIFELLRLANISFVSGEYEAYRDAVLSLEMNLIQYCPPDYVKYAQKKKLERYNREDKLQRWCKNNNVVRSQLDGDQKSDLLRKWNELEILSIYACLYRKLLQVCHNRGMLLNTATTSVLPVAMGYGSLDEVGGNK